MDRLLLLITLVVGQTPVESKFQQVFPVLRDSMERTPGRTRAVLLLPGLRPHPINSAKVFEPQFHDWELAGSVLVKSLARDSDVYAYAYSQNTRVERIAETPALANAVAKLKFLGYSEVVLLGHSTGGLLARLFVEDHPRAASRACCKSVPPNDGASLANLNIAVARGQEPFLQSLTKKERLACERITGR